MKLDGALVTIQFYWTALIKQTLMYLLPSVYSGVTTIDGRLANK